MTMTEVSETRSDEGGRPRYTGKFMNPTVERPAPKGSHHDGAEESRSEETGAEEEETQERGWSKTEKAPEGAWSLQANHDKPASGQDPSRERYDHE